MFKFIIILTLVTLTLVKADSEALCTGCLKQLEGDDMKDVEEQLNLSLTKLAAGTGPNYRLGKINAASSQVVSGTKYTINADLIDGDNKTKSCNIFILSQPWKENGIKTTFECSEEGQLTQIYSV